MNGQLVLLRLPRTSRVSQNVTAALKYLPPDQRAKHARRPLLVELAGFVPAQIAVGAARKATRNRLNIHLDPLPDAAIAMHITMAFVASEAQRLASTTVAPGLADAYDLYTLPGYTDLYQAVLGTVKGCPTTGAPTDWAPELRWVMDTTQLASPEISLSAADLQLLIDSIDINTCFRVADPAAQSVPLQNSSTIATSRSCSLPASNSCIPPTGYPFCHCHTADSHSELRLPHSYWQPLRITLRSSAAATTVGAATATSAAIATISAAANTWCRVCF